MFAYLAILSSGFTDDRLALQIDRVALPGNQTVDREAGVGSEHPCEELEVNAVLRERALHEASADASRERDRLDPWRACIRVPGRELRLDLSVGSGSGPGTGYPPNTLAVAAPFTSSSSRLQKRLR